MYILYNYASNICGCIILAHLSFIWITIGSVHTITDDIGKCIGSGSSVTAIIAIDIFEILKKCRIIGNQFVYTLQTRAIKYILSTKLY